MASPSCRKLSWNFWNSSPQHDSDSEKIPFIPLRTDDIFDDQDSVSTGSHGSFRPWGSTCSALRGLAFNAGLELLPSFIANKFATTAYEPNDHKLHPTAFLDGIRGFASLFVFFYHFISAWHPRYNHGYAGPGDENNWYIVQLPFIRLFYAGPSMVMTFFVVSGFALSYKSLSLLRKGSLEAALQSLSSSVFRRPFRLFLPPLTSTFIVVLLIRLGAFEPSRSYANDPGVIAGAREHHTQRFDTFWEQIEDWLHESHQMCDLFQGGGINLYDGHLWTIPHEFHWSMVLFFTILGLSKLKSTIRAVVMIILLLYAVYVDPGVGLSFYSGMVMAELWLATNSSVTKPSHDSEGIPILSCLKTAMWWLVFVAGLYTASIPLDWWEETPGYSFLATLHSNKDFWYSTAAFLTVWSTSNSTSIQTLFTNRFAQYLGNISYALYLCHGMFLHTIGYILIPKLWEFTGRETLAQYELAFGLAAVIVIPCVIWGADVFWRWVDIPAVKLARRVEELVSVKYDG